MLSAAELDAMRATSRSALAATGKISRRAAPGPLDPITGLLQDRDPTTIYEGPARIRPLVNRSYDAQIGDLPETIGLYEVTIPWDAGDVHVDDFFEVLDGTDPDLTARAMRVVDVRFSEWQIDRRLLVQDRERDA